MKIYKILPFFLVEYLAKRYLETFTFYANNFKDQHITVVSPDKGIYFIIYK
jgi:hypothetical protein